MKVLFTIEVDVDSWDDTDNLNKSAAKACKKIDELFSDEFDLEVESDFVIMQ
jgi:hypothetical protein